jgi:hypothetical protein
MPVPAGWLTSHVYEDDEMSGMVERTVVGR